MMPLLYVAVILRCIFVVEAAVHKNPCENCLYGADFCDVTTKQCNFHCVQGWMTATCTEPCTIDRCKECMLSSTGVEKCISCEAGWYGFLCNLRCGQFCEGHGTDDICDNQGSCIYGCVGGYEGNKCDIQYCPFSNCQSCSMTASGYSYCQHCKPGYYFQWEALKCVSCSEQCVNGQKDCRTDNGKCPNGCKENWYGDMCNNYCAIENCKFCDQRDTRVVCTYCKSGYTPSFDMESCVPCGNHCMGNCDSGTGHCLTGCEPGWFGDMCDKICHLPHCKRCADSSFGGVMCDECQNGAYAVDQLCQLCPSVCADGPEVCDKSLGHCVHGCKPGRYGSFCQYTCSVHCVNNSCDSVSGNCACEQDWYGPRCDRSCPTGCSTCDHFTNGRCPSCKPDSWGTTCEHKCGSHCQRDGYTGYIYCNQDTGSCDDGCSSGFHGSHCNMSCGANCNAGVCHRTNGHCSAGCTIYWYGETCSQKCGDNCIETTRSGVNRPCDMTSGACLNGCHDGFYGDNCTENCSVFCKEGTCFQPTGWCHTGCVYGYTGVFCNISCGQDCPNQCSPKCIDGICDESNVCTKGCMPGYYGNTCHYICNANCLGGTCLQSSGECSAGCKDRLYGAQCQWECAANCGTPTCHHTTGDCNACIARYYGVACSDECPMGCKNGTCQFETGQCDGCIVGLRGSFCTEMCRPGQHGENCDMTCGHCKDSSQCDLLTGWCPGGCEYGWTGSTCSDMAPISAESKGKAKNVALTAGSSVAAVLFVSLVIVGVVMAYRKNRVPKSPKTPTPEPVVYSTAAETVDLNLLSPASTSLQRESSDISIHGADSSLLGDPSSTKLRLGQKVSENDNCALYTGKVVHHGVTRTTCIKLLKVSGDGSGSSYKTWLSREAEFLSTCGPHPNIVSIFTTHTHADVYCTALDSCLQSCILPYLTSLPPADSTEAVNVHQLLQFAIDIAMAVAHLHTCKIIHRHIMGTSVYVSDSLVAKLGDFDWAIDDISQEDLTKLTPMHQLPDACGRWLAPECFLKDEYSCQTDIWSAGIFVWEVFTCGLLPFADTDLETMKQTVIDGVRPAKPNLAQISLYRVMKSCWRYSPEDRPTADQLLQQLQDIQARHSTDVMKIVVQV